MSKYYVKSVAQMMRCYNLPTVDENKRRMSLILTRGEVSRPLTEEEYKSPEVQKGLSTRDLLDVSRQMNG